MKIRVRDAARFAPDKMVKQALATTPRAQLDLYCLEPGQAQKRHAHDGQDKIYYVVEGSGRFAVGDREERLAAGDAVVAASGVEHGVVNDGRERLLVLVVVTPPPPHA